MSDYIRTEDSFSEEVTHDPGLGDDGPSSGRRAGVAASCGLRAARSQMRLALPQ